MTEYELTRRDALAALTAAGIGVASGGFTWAQLSEDETEPETVSLSANDRRTLDRLATTIYPSTVSGIPEFVETYVVGRLDDHPGREAEMVAAIETVDSYAREWYDQPFRELDTTQREDTLDRMGLDVAEADPDGHSAQRVRFYLVNELLFALYSSPTGARLVGLENPQGHPGGTTSYRQGPE